MNESLPFQKLDSYVVAKELAVRVHRSRIQDAELRDQASRASKSAFLQLAEGLPNDSIAMRRKYFICARNSVCEVVAAVDLAMELGAMDRTLGEQIISTGGRLRALLIGLCR